MQPAEDIAQDNVKEPALNSIPATKTEWFDLPLAFQIKSSAIPKRLVSVRKSRKLYLEERTVFMAALKTISKYWFELIAAIRKKDRKLKLP